MVRAVAESQPSGGFCEFSRFSAIKNEAKLRPDLERNLKGCNLGDQTGGDL
jgi:hypothetical protein